MQGKLITPIILLVALLFTSIINIIYKIDHLESMIRLCIVFVLFFIVGKVAQRIITKAIDKDKPPVKEVEELEDYMVEGMDELTTSEE